MMLGRKIGLLIPVLAIVTGAAFHEAAAQTGKKIPRVGLLRVDSPPRKPVDDFRAGLKELGYLEGENVLVDIRWAASNPERLREMAKDLVGSNFDVIVTHGPQGVRAVKSATNSIPIVIGRIDDIDMHGFVTNLAHPGGNITGLSFQTVDLTGKCLELLKQIVPNLATAAALWDATSNSDQVKAMDAAARALSVKLHVLDVRAIADFDPAMESAKQSQARALLILGSPFLTFNAARLAKLTVKHRLPAIYTNTSFAETGGLLAYGPNESDPAWGWRRAAVYVDKILKGAKPGDLPIEQPTKFGLIINLNTAKRIGVIIPPDLLARADRVIR
jgi:putative ABC transport system substrate-binding protein